MSVKVINMSINRITNAGITFGHSHYSSDKNNEVQPSVKRGVLLTTITGVGAASAIIAKNKVFHLILRLYFLKVQKIGLCLKSSTKMIKMPG